MENAKTLHALDDFAKNKPKDIPKELDDYLRHVAASGDPVYQWSLVKFLFRQKLLNVVMEFYENCPMMDIPISPNLDPFNFETIKKQLLERYDLFTGVPFTIQRIAELLTAPRKQYNRLDKYMRALEKNVWVVSTREPASRETSDQLNLVNGDLSTAHIDNEENDTEQLQGETDNSEEQTNCDESPKTNEVNENENEAEPAETPLVEAVEVFPETEPEKPFTSSETNEALAEGTIELATSDSDHAIEDKTDDSSCAESLTEPDSTVKDTEEKTEDIVVVEVDEKDTVKSVENIEPVSVIEPPTEEETLPVQCEQETPRTGVKRKCEDDEEPSPCKKADTESGESEESEESLEPVQEIENKATVVQVAEFLEIREAESSMDSTEIEEKLAMVVEEPELAMEVDETSMQSPMVQEDVVEAMEESEPTLS